MTIGSHRILNRNILAVLLLLFLPVLIGHAGPNGRTVIETQLSTISFMPSVLNTSISQGFTLNLSISDTTDLYLWVATIQWNASLLNLTNYSEGPFLKQEGSTTFIVGKTAPGKIEGLTCSLIGSVPGVNGNGTLASFQFKALALGTTSIDITFSDLLDSEGVSIPHNTVSSTVDVIGDHDVSIMNVSSDKTVVGQGYCLNITVTAADLGDYRETFNVTRCANTTIIASQDVTLSAEDSVTITFTWNTTDFALGNYTLTAYAWPVPGENNTANNNFTGGVVTVTIPGDINGDFHVDHDDVVLLSDAYGTSPSQPVKGSCVWNPNADLDNNGLVGLVDLVTMAAHYGQHYP
jgi:hypothetical protein